MKIGDRVHIDSDNKQWGRVCGKATVQKVQKKYVLVLADSIRANIFVLRSEIN